MKNLTRYAKAGPVGEARMTSPTPEQLAKINYLSRRKLAGDEVYVGFVDLANDLVDRTYERFPVEILKQFAATAPGCSVLMGHDYSGPPVGLFFDAKVVKLGDVNWLRCWYYMPKTAENEHVRAMIDGGVYRYASIGFGAADGGGKLDLVCDLCGGSLFGRSGCEHWPGEEYAVGKQSARAVFHYEGQARMVEGSIVYLGAQYDAEMKGLGMETMMADRLAQDMAISHAAAFTKSFEGVVVPRRKEVGESTGDNDNGSALEDGGETPESEKENGLAEASELTDEQTVKLPEGAPVGVELEDVTDGDGGEPGPEKILSAGTERVIAELVEYHVRKNLENLRSRLAGMMAEAREG